MDKTCFLVTAGIIAFALFIVLVVVLKDGKVNFSLKKDKNKDVLVVEAEHQRNKFDK